MATEEVWSPVELGRHLMQVRERSGIKQAELAKRVALSPTVLSRIESGDHVIVFCLNKKVVKKVEKLFEVGFHFF